MRDAVYRMSKQIVYSTDAESPRLKSEAGEQEKQQYVTPRPGLLTRVFFRLPVYMYRIHLGWLFDHRVLCLIHRGRNTGKIRRNCIEVVHYDPERKESFVVSAYGKRSDWFRNIKKNAPIELKIGREKFVPDFRVLPAPEAHRILKQVFADHPGEGRMFLKRVFHLPPTEAQFEGLADLVPVIAFRPKSPD